MYMVNYERRATRNKMSQTVMRLDMRVGTPSPLHSMRTYLDPLTLPYFLRW